jgi:hypothetical protein
MKNKRDAMASRALVLIIKDKLIIYIYVIRAPES